MFGGRRALHQHHNGRIDVDNQPTDGDEIEKPLSLGMRSIPNTKKKCTNRHFTESNGVQDDDLAHPGPFHGGHGLRWSKKVNVVAESRMSGEGVKRLSRYGRELPSPPSATHWAQMESHWGSNQSYHGPDIIPTRFLHDDHIGICS